MRRISFIAVSGVFTLFLACNSAIARPSPVSATCNISCTVAETAEWSNNSFPAIELPEITTEKSKVCGRACLVLYTNGNVEITADNSNTARLSKDEGHKLVTEYKLEYDASGANQTGGSTVEWTTYNSFLKKASTVIHVCGDGAVEVILSVRTSNKSKNPRSSGDYSATQTLTACWKS